MILVSVIVPVYRVERFIRRCAASLMQQTMTHGVEYIFVDDCSPDQSVDVIHEVLADYPERSSNVKIVSHEVNKGLPAARNTGLACATGKYIFHCDSDDYLELDALQKLVETAEENDADVVWSDWYLSFEQSERYMKQPEYTTADDAVRGMLHGRMKYNVWNKLVRHTLYEKNDIKFPDGHGMGEDMTMIRLFACASKVAYIPKGLYHYVKTNGEAFTNRLTKKNLQDIRYNVNVTLDFLTQQRGLQFCHDMACFKLNVKYPFLISSDKAMYALWREWYPEANSYICKNKEASLRSRILQYAAWKRQFWLVWLHYQMIYRFIYGIIYK